MEKLAWRSSEAIWKDLMSTFLYIFTDDMRTNLNSWIPVLRVYFRDPCGEERASASPEDPILVDICTLRLCMAYLFRQFDFIEHLYLTVCSYLITNSI